MKKTMNPVLVTITYFSAIADGLLSRQEIWLEGPALYRGSARSVQQPSGAIYPVSESGYVFLGRDRAKHGISGHVAGEGARAQ